MWIDVTGCAHLHGGEAPMLALLVEQLARQGLRGRVAVADTPDAAHALARFGGKAIDIVAIGGTADALAPLPVAALRLGGPILDGLRRFGQHSCQDSERSP